MTETVDVVIVGAGAAGLYTAWQLLDRKAAQSVVVLESSQRIGGRLLSASPPGAPDIVCELGGMRYTRAQPLVTQLIEDVLKLETEPMPVEQDKNLVYVRGRHARQGQLATGDGGLPYQLSWAESQLAPSELMVFALEQIVPGVTSPNITSEQRAALIRGAVVDGRPLYAWGFWNLIARALSHEAYELVREVGGYDSAVMNWNAASTVNLALEIEVGAEFRRVTAGYEQVPLGLAGLVREGGGQVRLGHRVSRVTTDEAGRVRVKGDSGSAVDMSARALVLAMPRRAIELLDAAGPVLGDPEARRLLRTVTPVPLLKLFLAYDTPWWRDTLGVTTGRSVTDLPLRQCYYWHTPDPVGSGAGSQIGVLLASYDDGTSVGFWEGLRADPLTAAPDPSRMPADEDGGDATERWNAHAAPPAMVDEAHRQLELMHGVSAAPKPSSAAFVDWGTDPYGGGVNFWNIGVPYWEVMPRIVQPVAGVPIYVCGEAYSDAQGWVEGALATAQEVLGRLTAGVGARAGAQGA